MSQGFPTLDILNKIDKPCRKSSQKATTLIKENKETGDLNKK